MTKRKGHLMDFLWIETGNKCRINPHSKFGTVLIQNICISIMQESIEF